MIVAFDARSLGPETRHWGVGVVIDNILSRLNGRFSFVGITHRFQGAAAQGLRTWPRLPKTNALFFEASTLLAGPFDLYWGANHFVPASCQRPAVVTVHDLLLLKYPHEQPHSGMLARRLTSSVRRARRVLADSRTTADDLIEAIPEVRGKVQVATLGFESCEAVVPGGGSQAEPYVIMLGAHHPRKNLAFAAEVMRKLQEAGMRVPLRLTGDVHPCFAEILRSHAACIQPTGVLPKQQVFTLLRHARAMIFPSRYEGFGFPVLEAMAAGCPVLALDTPINRETGGDAAWFLPDDAQAWANAIQELLRSTWLASDMSGKGAENVKRFSWDHTAEIYADAFAGLYRQ